MQVLKVGFCAVGSQENQEYLDADLILTKRTQPSSASFRDAFPSRRDKLQGPT